MLFQRRFFSKIQISKYDGKGGPFLKNIYEKLESNLNLYRGEKNMIPLTLSEKILYSHLENPNQKVTRGETYLKLKPDRVAMQDATAQMALLQFISSNMKKVAVPTTIHCDHLILAKTGADSDLEAAKDENEEIYNFLHSASQKYNIGFWKPGSGIIHQILLENYAFPGGLMIGTDSHTPNAGGLGMLAIGVGGADAVDSMTGSSWELKCPKILGIKLVGSLQKWVTSKDIILTLAGMLTVKGGTGYILEYFGPGVKNLSCTGMATICNMGAELGATTSIFPYQEKMSQYLEKTDRKDISTLLEKNHNIWVADENANYDEIIELNLETIQPMINGPFSPDIHNIVGKEFKKTCKEKKWPLTMSSGLIGSCTNSSYEDLSNCADLTNQALQHGLTFKMPFYITPGSDKIKKTMERDGFTEIFEKAGGTILANACGPCIGQWKREDGTTEKNSIVTSYNRNFAKRNDGNEKTHTFVTSPEHVVMCGFSGRIDFDPKFDFILTDKGKKFKFKPVNTEPLPKKGFDNGEPLFLEPSTSGSNVIIDKNSNRIALLEKFKAWDGKDILTVPVLIKVKGKCTTDHISMAGPWLKYRGHIDNISNNMLIGAVNDDNNKVNLVYTQLTGDFGKVPEVARYYKSKNKSWIIVGDENYGEGSSREHAAIEPRYLGCRVVLVKSFARIHETNLKKQGILALTFANKTDYEKLNGRSKISVLNLENFVNKLEPLELVIYHASTPEKIKVNHSYTKEQVKWFKYGSALNFCNSSGKN